MELDTHIDSLAVYEALASETRLAIINLLGDKNSLNLTEIAQNLHLSNPIITRHIQKLYETNLVNIQKKPGLSGTQKIVRLNIDDIHIHFPGRVYPEYSLHTSDIGIGLYSNYQVYPTCGLLNPKGYIGNYDDPRYFADNNRVTATLLWFSEGYIEYSVPNPMTQKEYPKILEFSLELASEYQLSNNHWPSDITISVNQKEIGTYTVPGNFSDVRGKLTPLWWEDNLSQYGLLKTFRINTYNSKVDGDILSDVSIEDLKIQEAPVITLRFEVKRNAIHRGGLTIFGENFGNHPQNIKLNLYYSEQSNENPNVIGS